jgi:N-acetylneuraminate synthase
LDAARESPWGKTQGDQKRGLEFTAEQYWEIDRYCKQKGIKWFASAWDIESQKFLRQFKLEYNKIASAMIVYEELLREVASEGRYTFISTGMSTLKDVDRAVEIFKKAKCPFELMHCISTYPMDDEDANLARLVKLRERYGCKVGYSGHEVGLSISYAAVALGATSLERHITLSRAMYGSDQSASVEPAGFRQMVGAVRKIEKALGNGSFDANPKEIPVAKKLRAHLAWESSSLEGTVYQQGKA